MICQGGTTNFFLGIRDIGYWKWEISRFRCALCFGLRSRINGQKAEAFPPPFLVRREIEAPQRSVIRGHRRGDATLFSFVLEDAAPPTRITWSIMNSSQKSQRGCSGRRLLVFKNISPTVSPLLSRARLIVG